MTFEQPKLSIKEKYLNSVDKDGYIFISDFCWNELNKQCKSIAALLDGDSGTEPEYNLGKNLNYIGNSGNYTDMKIHINDLEKFIKRVKNHYQ